FNENIAIGTGNVYIRKYSDNSVVQTIDITSCSVLGDDLTIDPADLEYSTQYYVEMDNTCIDDLYANDFAGFTGNSVWSFTTEDAPCYNPTILTAINVTGTTADLGWTAGGTETSWDIEVGAPGFTPGTGTALFTYSGVTSNPYTATGLTQLTSYQFYVRAVCGAETSTWTGPNSFTTICSAISAFPYSESFEATTAPPACWTMYYGDATPVAGNLMTHSTTYAYVGTRSFRFSSISSDAVYTEYLVTPELNIASAKDLSFWYRKGSGTESFTVGTSTTGNNIATDFTWGSNVTNASITWQQYTASIPAGVKYIAIRYNSSYQYYLYIDKFELLEPPTCIVPTALASSSVTYNSATVSWTASTSNPANGYQIYYSTSSTAPDAATIPTATVGAGITTYNMTGLNANTLYYVWVRSDCGAGDYSTWAGSVSFTTLCAPVTSYPVNEPFTSYLPSTCWNEGDNGDLTAGPVTISATASSWIADGFLNVGTTGAAKINIDATGDNDWIISPELTIPATPAYRFTYSVGATQFGGTVAPTTAWEADDFVQVLVSTSGYTNWTELKLYGSTNVPSHLGQTDILDLSAYAGQTIRIAFRGVEGAANGSADIDFFTDNWVIEETPLCSAPTTLTASGITSSQANLGWTETGTSTTWDIEIGLTGFVPSGTPTYNDVTSNPYTVNGLSAVTGYSYYVRSDCGGSQSVWTGPFNFNTGQEPAVLTFTEGFEIWPNGWSVVNGTQANAWYVGTATANSGNQSAYISNDNGLTNAYTITTTSVVHMYRDIAIPATTFPITVKFNWRGQGEGVAYDRLRVYMVETSVTPVAGTELTSGQIGLTNYNLQPDWTLSSLELPAATYSGATWRLVFTWKNDISDGTQPPIAIDDIEVSLVTCPDPTALTASSLQTNQATLSWTENGTATSWDIELGADGFTPTGTPTQTGVTNPYIYTGLTEATAYDYYVRSDCGAGDYSAWVGPFGFNTLASCAEPTTLTAANITSSSADLGWTAVGGTTTWNVEVGAVGFIPGTGAEVVAITGTTNNPTSVNGLSAQTTYLFYVQSDCGGGQLSNWAGPFSFTTP
ncbi:MAG TPA: choice-of-anchor J domain-containing protein, partial [Bacteroidales bacterium]|nr:choice-of-anchor J domain-containing protein [Bacteroidales bacterium]